MAPVDHQLVPVDDRNPLDFVRARLEKRNELGYRSSPNLQCMPAGEVQLRPCNLLCHPVDLSL